MNLTQFAALCARVDAFCIYARRRAPYGEPELLERAAALEAELLEEHNTHGEALALACVELAGSPARAELVARYKQSICAVPGQIQALADDLASRAVSCPESVRGALILALKGLYTLCRELVAVCLAEFAQIVPQKAGEGKTVPQMIEGSPQALAVAQRLRDAGYLDSAYKWRPGEGRTVYDRGLAGQRLAALAGCGQRVIEDYWSIRPRQISKDASAAPADCPVRDILDA